MDQLKKILSWLKQYHFWVLSVVIAAVGLACWYTSASALSKQYSDNQAKIQQAFNTPQRIAAEPFHPNDAINEKQREQIQMRAQTVAELWRQLYDRQRSEVLKWPEKALSQSFRDEVEKLKFGQEIRRERRDFYMNYISNHFPVLPAKIQAHVVEPGAIGFGGRGSSGDRGGDFSRDPDSGLLALNALEPDYVCEWRDQANVQAALHFTETPSSLQIWVTQEDLWAYHTLLDVIAATNASVQADRPDNAAVRVVDSLTVGQKAVETSHGERITLDPSVRATNRAIAAGEGRDRGDSEASPDGRGGGSGVPTLEQDQVRLLSGRYVNASGAPIPVSGGGLNYQTAFGTEYKRLPVRLVLQMDVRSLTYLIAQCANQPLQVEVQEVRINPADGGVSAGSSRSARGQDFSGGSRLGVGGVETFPANPNLATVVIQGVIYIFNEPSPKILEAASGENSDLALN